MTIRPPEESELDELATIWFESWRDAHAALVPEELARIRTWDNFRERLPAGLADTRVAGEPGAPVGFCMLKGDELYQLFVTAAARGTGVAKALIADAETRLAAAGVKTAWLACAIGNDRAARFYEKSGWHRAGTILYKLDTVSGPPTLEVWRYEKVLQPSA